MHANLLAVIGNETNIHVETGSVRVLDRRNAGRAK